jgi:hypothetical protein
MAIRLIPCRHKDTGAEAEIAETALRYFPDYVPAGENDRKRYGYDKPDSNGEPSDQSAAPAGESTTPPAPKTKPAASAAKNTPKE